MTDREKILDRLRKLRALAGSSNQHESENAKEQILRLKEQHQVSEEELSTSDASNIAERPLEGIDFEPDWRLGILTCLAMRYGCKALRYFEPGGKSTGAVVGNTDVAEVITQLFIYFDEKVMECARTGWMGAKADMLAIAERLRLESLDTLLGEAPVKDTLSEKEKAEIEAWMKEWEERNHERYLDSFARGATISLQERILSGDFDVWQIWRERGQKADEDAARWQDEIRAAGTIIKADPTAISKNLVDEHLRGKPIEKFSGLGGAPDRKAFTLGKVAGSMIPMPGMRQDVLPRVES